MCRGQLSGVISRVVSKCLWSGWNWYRVLNFMIVVFSIVEKVNRVKRQYLTLVDIYCAGWMVTIWSAVEYIKKGPLATKITTHHLVRIPLCYCWSMFFFVFNRESWRNGKRIKLKVISSLFVEIFSLVCSLFTVLRAGYLELRFSRYISNYQARWWEKHLSKRSFIKHTFSWRDKLIICGSRYSFNDKRNKLKTKQFFFYNLSNTLCLFEEPLQVKYLKHHAFISMCYLFTRFNPQIMWSTILLGTHPIFSD